MREPGEFERIAAIVARLPAGEGVIVGPGDDAAVLRPTAGMDLVATTDTLVESRHYDIRLPAGFVGTRLAAANLSDIAAMAAIPRWALVSLVAGTWTAEQCELVELACAQALAGDGAVVVGGNLSSGQPSSATLTLLGEVECGRAWTRAGARPRDLLAVTGAPGSAALWHRSGLLTAELEHRVCRQPSRVRLARALAAAGGVRAAIDLSDGLLSDLAHLCRAAGVGARVDDARFPDDPVLRRALEVEAGMRDRPGRKPGGPEAGLRSLRYGPSDDYELLLAIDPAAWPRCEAIARDHHCPLTAIGEFLEAPGVWLRDTGGHEVLLEPRGWDHFGPDLRR